DGSAVDGKYEVTGILSYFTVGHDNEGPTREVTYVLRKLDAGVKAKIERTEWNRSDYATELAGENILELKFEIHAEEGHHHYPGVLRFFEAVERNPVCCLFWYALTLFVKTYCALCLQEILTRTESLSPILINI